MSNFYAVGVLVWAGTAGLLCASERLSQWSDGRTPRYGNAICSGFGAGCGAVAGAILQRWLA